MRNYAILLFVFLICGNIFAAGGKAADKEEEQRFRVFMYERFYESWVRDGGLTFATKEFLDEIDESYYEGMPGAVYKKNIDEIWKKKVEGKGFSHFVDERENVRMNYLITDSFIQYTKALYFGVSYKKYKDKESLIQRDEKDYYSLITNKVKYSFGITDIRGLSKALRPGNPIYAKFIDTYKKIDGIEQSKKWQIINEFSKIKPNTTSAAVAVIRNNLFLLYGIETEDNSDYYDVNMLEYVKKYQRSIGQSDTGVINEQMIKSLNTALKWQKRILEANMERLRRTRVEFSDRYIYVNIPSYKLRLINKGKTETVMKVIVGKRDRKTPVLVNTMRYFVVNPTWVIPESIIKKDVIDSYLKDPEYFKKKKIKIIKDKSLPEVDPTTLVWEKENIKTLRNYKFVQEADEINSLGKVKFVLENKENIYLHDTNTRELFKRTERMFSSGCVRVEQPLVLAEKLFYTGKKYQKEYLKTSFEKRKNYYVGIPNPIKVYILYLTADVNEMGEMVFYKDIYGKDSETLMGMAKIK